MKKFFCFFSFSGYCLLSSAQLSVTELPFENNNIESTTDLFNFYIENVNVNAPSNQSFNIIISVFNSKNEMVISSVLKCVVINDNFNPLIYMKSSGVQISSTYGTSKESKYLKSNGRFLSENLLHAYLRIEDSSNGIIFYQTNFAFGDCSLSSTPENSSKNASLLLRSDLYYNGDLENKYFFAQTVEAGVLVKDIPLKIGVQYSTFTDPCLHNFNISYDYESYLLKMKEKHNANMIDSLKILNDEKLKYNNVLHSIDSLNRVKSKLLQNISNLSQSADASTQLILDSLNKEAQMIDNKLFEKLSALKEINHRLDSIRRKDINTFSPSSPNLNQSAVKDEFFFSKPHISAFNIGRFSDCISEYTFWGGNVTGVKTGLKIRNTNITVLAGDYRGFANPDVNRKSYIYYLKSSHKFYKSGNINVHINGYHHENKSGEIVPFNFSDNIVSGIEANYQFMEKFKIESGYFRSYVSQNASSHSAVFSDYFSPDNDDIQNAGTLVYFKTSAEILRNNFLEYKVDFISDNYITSGNPFLQNSQRKHSVSSYHGLLDNRIKLVFSGNKIQRYNTADFFQASASLKVNFRGYPGLLVTYSPAFQSISDSISQKIELFIVQSNFQKSFENSKHILIAQFTNQMIDNYREGIVVSQNLSHSIFNYDLIFKNKYGFKCRIEYTKRAISDYNVFSQSGGFSLKIKSVSNSLFGTHYSVLGFHRYNVSYRFSLTYKKISMFLEYAILYSGTMNQEVFLNPNRMSASLTIKF